MHAPLIKAKDSKHNQIKKDEETSDFTLLVLIDYVFGDQVEKNSHPKAKGYLKHIKYSIFNIKNKQKKKQKIVNIPYTSTETLKQAISHFRTQLSEIYIKKEHFCIIVDQFAHKRFQKLCRDYMVALPRFFYKYFTVQQEFARHFITLSTTAKHGSNNKSKKNQKTKTKDAKGKDEENTLEEEENSEKENESKNEKSEDQKTKIVMQLLTQDHKFEDPFTTEMYYKPKQLIEERKFGYQQNGIKNKKKRTDINEGRGHKYPKNHHQNKEFKYQPVSFMPFMNPPLNHNGMFRPQMLNAPMNMFTPTPKMLINPRQPMRPLEQMEHMANRPNYMMNQHQMYNSNSQHHQNRRKMNHYSKKQNGQGKKSVVLGKKFKFLSQPDEPEVCSVLRLRGLPWTSAKESIIEFFNDIQFAEDYSEIIETMKNQKNGENNSQISCDDSTVEETKKLDDKKSEEIHQNDSKSKDENESSMEKENIKKENEETIETNEEKETNEEQKTEKEKEKDEDVLLKESNIVMMISQDGRPTGEAYVRLKNPQEVEKAMKRDLLYIGDRYIEIFYSSEAEFQFAYRHSKIYRDQLDRSNVIRIYPCPVEERKFLHTFFAPHQISNIFFLWRKNKSTTAYIRFENKDGLNAALKQKNVMMNGKRAGIHLTTDDEMAAAIKFAINQKNRYKKQNFVAPYAFPPMMIPVPGGVRLISPHIVRLRGLPYEADEVDIDDFFHDIDIIDGGIHMIVSHQKKQQVTGEAYVELASEASLQGALAKNKQMMKDRYIEVFHASPGDMQNYLTRLGINPHSFSEQEETGNTDMEEGVITPKDDNNLSSEMENDDQNTNENMIMESQIPQ